VCVQACAGARMRVGARTGAGAGVCACVCLVLPLPFAKKRIRKKQQKRQQLYKYTASITNCFKKENAYNYIVLKRWCNKQDRQRNRQFDYNG